MKGTLLAALTALMMGLGASLTAANAMPMSAVPSVSADDAVILVREGCGRGWHRNWRGRCVPNCPWRYCRWGRCRY
jgi:hypothetical protein